MVATLRAGLVALSFGAFAATACAQGSVAFEDDDSRFDAEENFGGMGGSAGIGGAGMGGTVGSTVASAAATSAASSTTASTSNTSATAVSSAVSSSSGGVTSCTSSADCGAGMCCLDIFFLCGPDTMIPGVCVP